MEKIRIMARVYQGSELQKEQIGGYPPHPHSRGGGGGTLASIYPGVHLPYYIQGVPELKDPEVSHN